MRMEEIGGFDRYIGGRMKGFSDGGHTEGERES